MLYLIMNQAKRQNILEALIRLLNSFSPEYIDQSPEASKLLYSLLDSIEKFEVEVEDEQKVSDEKYL